MYSGGRLQGAVQCLHIFWNISPNLPSAVTWKLSPNQMTTWWEGERQKKPQKEQKNMYEERERAQNAQRETVQLFNVHQILMLSYILWSVCVCVCVCHGGLPTKSISLSESSEAHWNHLQHSVLQYTRRLGTGLCVHVCVTQKANPILFPSSILDWELC